MQVRGEVEDRSIGSPKVLSEINSKEMLLVSQKSVSLVASTGEEYKIVGRSVVNLWFQSTPLLMRVN